MCTWAVTLISYLNLRKVSTLGAWWATVDSTGIIFPAWDPVRDTRQITGTGFKPSITELTTDGEIAQGTGEIDLPVGNVRRTPGKLERQHCNNNYHKDGLIWGSSTESSMEVPPPPAPMVPTLVINSNVVMYCSGQKKSLNYFTITEVFQV